MAQIINSTNFSDFVANMHITFHRAFDQFLKRASKLYDVENVSVSKGDESSLSGFSVAKIKRENADFSYLDINQGYRKSWTVYEIGGMTKISWLMRTANRYNDMEQRISNLGESAAKRMEWDKTHRFTFAYDTSYTSIDGDTITTTVGDGFALCYSAHTETGTSTTFRNAVANNPELTKGGLEAAELLFATQMIDENGELIQEMPDTLVIANYPNYINTALEYLRSVAAPDAAHEGVTNVYYKKYELLVLPWLATTAAGAYNSAKAKYWFLANTKGTSAVCKVLQSPVFIPPTYNDGKEFETMDWKFACHAAYALEILRGQWIVGSKGDSS